MWTVRALGAMLALIEQVRAPGVRLVADNKLSEPLAVGVEMPGQIGAERATVPSAGGAGA